MMFCSPRRVRVFIALGATDMRKAINGLSLMVATQLDLDPLSGHLFAFCNRRRTLVKILYWERNGFCLWEKRLEKDRFKWPGHPGEVKEISIQELGLLLEGIDIGKIRPYRRLNYTAIN